MSEGMTRRGRLVVSIAIAAAVAAAIGGLVHLLLVAGHPTLHVRAFGNDIEILERRTEFRAFLRVMVTESARHPDLAFAGEAAGLVDVIGLIASTLDDEAGRHGYQLADSRMFATVLLRMAASGPQLDALLFANFRPGRDLLEAHARWITTIFLHGIEPRTAKVREVAPPARDYAYPWLPDVPADGHSGSGS